MKANNQTPKKNTRRKKPVRLWHLVTNHQNMLYMLAAGLVMSPAGFRGKHYSDPLDVYSGSIPLFRDKTNFPTDVLNYAISERKHLIPCIATFDLSDLSNPVQVLSQDGSLRDAATPAARKRKDDMAILVRAPLPMTLLSRISFRSQEEKQTFENAAKNVSNVDISIHRIEISEPLFKSENGIPWPPEQLQEALLSDDENHPPAQGDALGGVLTMLYHLANRSDLGLATFQLVSESTNDIDSELIKSDPILSVLPNWISGNSLPEKIDIRATLYWGVVNSLIASQTQQRPEAPIDVVLSYLDSKLNQLQEAEFKNRLERLIKDMRSCLGFGGGTITEMLERHKGSLSRPLLLFCLRDNCTELLEFSHSLLSNAEFLLAGILFGVRDGWLQLPKEMRNPDLSAYVTYRMADSEHRLQGDSLAMNIPTAPSPLRKAFQSPNNDWNEIQEDIAMEIANKCHWNDCVKTTLTLAEGDLPKSFERNGLQLTLPGKITQVSEKIDKTKFLHRLGHWPPIAQEIEAEIRNKIEEIPDETKG